ncbi:MAG: 50S ribosomal protein L13 [Gammaproteobacteria bacterium]|nr:50S ribosomal protein L13 [Gammaproteobacteria bacterium]MBL6819262.1 50S ribosomal protein L13 [Gammaproteobacteria bacterium]MBL6898441.1 50S ribosomal protein L13 [Gammaproteobacteria bacterium]
MSIDDSNKNWYVIDATDVVLGRLASKVAHMLKGKHKPQYQPHTDEGDYIIVINAKKIRVTGNKLSDKMYYKHTGYIGNMKETPLGKMLDKKPDFVIKNAVKGMLPKNTLGRTMIKKLKIYDNENHGHNAQKPVTLEV